MCERPIDEAALMRQGERRYRRSAPRVRGIDAPGSEAQPEQAGGSLTPVSKLGSEDVEPARSEGAA
jgi:hypothetical protein